MSNLLAEAIHIASQFHMGQLDKAGKPYILHVLRVMLKVESEDEMIVAALHDVVEDTSVTINDLKYKFKIPEHIVEAVEAITHLDGEPHMDYIKRCALNKLALRVKVADIADNSDPERMKPLDSATVERLKAKYKEALEYIEIEKERFLETCYRPEHAD